MKSLVYAAVAVVLLFAPSAGQAQNRYVEPPPVLVSLCLHTQRAARALARRFDVALKPAGISSGQFSLLMSLNRPKPPNLGSVAALLAMDRTTLTANLKPLERRGLVETAPDPTDRRARLLRLTPAGRAVLAEAVPIWRHLHAAIETALLDPDRLRSELNLLSRSGGNDGVAG